MAACRPACHRHRGAVRFISRKSTPTPITASSNYYCAVDWRAPGRKQPRLSEAAAEGARMGDPSQPAFWGSSIACSDDLESLLVRHPEVLAPLCASLEGRWPPVV